MKCFRQLWWVEMNDLWYPLIENNSILYTTFNSGIDREQKPEDYRFILSDGMEIIAGLRILCTPPCGVVSIWGETLDTMFIKEGKAEIMNAFAACVDLHRFDAATDARDSQRSETLTLLGFVKEGTLRKHIKIQERLIDIALWGLVIEKGKINA